MDQEWISDLKGMSANMNNDEFLGEIGRVINHEGSLWIIANYFSHRGRKFARLLHKSGFYAINLEAPVK